MITWDLPACDHRLMADQWPLSPIWENPPTAVTCKVNHQDEALKNLCLWQALTDQTLSCQGQLTSLCKNMAPPDWWTARNNKLVGDCMHPQHDSSTCHHSSYYLAWVYLCIISTLKLFFKQKQHPILKWEYLFSRCIAPTTWITTPWWSYRTRFTGFTGLKMAGLTVHLVNSGGHQADDMRPNLRHQSRIRSMANSQHPNSLAWGCLFTSEGLSGRFLGHWKMSLHFTSNLLQLAIP